MSDESPRLVPLPCVRCGGVPVAGYKLQNGQEINLCFDHMQEFEEFKLGQIGTYRELAQQAEDDIADVMGFPRKPRTTRIAVPKVNVHQATFTATTGV